MVRSPGFTLVELLVVMMLMALATSVWFGINFRQRDAFRLKTTARSLHSFLLASRSYALLADRDNECRYLPAEHRVTETLRQRQVAVPEKVVVSLPESDVAALPDQALRLATFYADGSAAGGPVLLQVGDRQLTVRIDPLLGGVAIAAGGDDNE